MKCGSELVVPSIDEKSQHFLKNIEPQHDDERPMSTVDFSDEILEIEEIVSQEIYEAVEEKVDDSASFTRSPPFCIIDFIGHQSIKAGSMPNLEEQDLDNSFLSKQTLRTMPLYIKEYKPNSVVMKIPSV